MGFLDKITKKLPQLKDKAEDLVEQHDDKIKDGLDKAAKLADKKTGGKHHDKIEKGVAKAKDTIDDLAEPEADDAASKKKR